MRRDKQGRTNSNKLNFGPGRISRLPLAIMIALASSQGAVYAQEADNLEEVVITGSRIRTNGMETPNPVTVVTPSEISLTSPTTMIEGLAQLPQFYQSNTTENTGGFFQTAGAGTLNLRGLQGKRTLTLLDGRRVVSSTIFGGPDINLFPENLVRTVETVTGGATAAYGTDAVAGAVNFVLDKNFEGFKGGIQTGQTARDDGKNYEISLAGGFALTEQTHLLLSVEKADQDGIRGNRADYDWYKGTVLLENPDTANRGTTPGNPFFLPYNNVVSRIAQLDGVLMFPAAAGGPLLFDKNGNTSPFVLGSASNNNAHSITNGGSGVDNGEPYAQILPDSGRENYFAYINHEINDNLTVYGQVMYDEASFTNQDSVGLFPNTAVGSRAFTIYSGNPFLPANVQQIMTANNIASVKFGRNGAPEDIGGNSMTIQDTKTVSFTTGFDYEIDSDGFLDGWAVNGYYQTGSTDLDAVQTGGKRLDRIYLAADAVVNPANGQTVCRVTLFNNDYNDCVPINLFGRGRASASAIDWVTGYDEGKPTTAQGFYSPTESIPYSYISGEDKRRVVELEQDVWEFSANGEIHSGFGAGPIAMALGYGQRSEEFVQYVQAAGRNPNADPRVRPVEADNAARGIRGVPGGAPASGNSVDIQFSNVPFGKGNFKVKEAFTEFRIPLLSDITLVQQFDLSLATRWANYEGTGDVWSWKFGTDWTVTDEVRVRGTISQDVRAATMGERYDRTGGLGNITDYEEDPAGASTSQYGITTASGGNPNVRPEEAKTFTAGVVYQPDWLEGLNMSMDWYSITIKDNIQQFLAATVVSNCTQNGDIDFCALITRGGDPSTIKPGLNRISLVSIPFTNQAQTHSHGIDFEISYSTDIDWFGGGESLTTRFLGSYLRENSSTNSVGLKNETTGVYGLPETNFQISGAYIRGPLSWSLQARYTDDTFQNLNWNHLGASTRWDVLDNVIESQVLVDTRVGYNFEVMGSNLNVYATINNLFDEDPIPSLGAFDTFGNAAPNGVVGDLRGRRYVVGLNFDF